MIDIRMLLFKRCPKTGRIIGLRTLPELPWMLAPVMGFLALVWFLIRVVPKPSRAAYPCQRVAAPLAGSFLVWLAGITGASLVLRHAREKLRHAHYLSAAVALITAAAGLGWALLGQGQPAQATLLEYTPHAVNSPIGTAKGLMPGRVAWAHNPLVTNWNGSGDANDNWYDHVNQHEATRMLEWALTGYANTTSTTAAWEAIFTAFNGGSAGYRPGEKIFIKVNQVTHRADNCADSSYNWTPSACYVSWTSIGNSPQLTVALLDQLVNVVGVAQKDITIGDSTGLWINELYAIVHAAFPDVKYLDSRGTLGRTKATKSSVPLYWSAPASELAGKNQDYLLQAVVDAKYMINLAVLKSHELAGITATAKNHYGSLSGGNNNVRLPNTVGFYDLHSRLPLETDAPAPPTGNRTLMGQYRPLVDLNGHIAMGGKTLLYLIDGIFSGKGWAGTPYKWTMTPFNNDWPSSLFLSMDQVAIDSVAFDFLSQQWPDEVLGNEGVQDYLHEMALANNPPSGTLYDPEDDGTAMSSQGVHEHWNNPTDKQYTRNLGTGNGIELVYLDGSPTCYSLTRTHTGAGIDPVASPANSPSCPVGQYVAGAVITLTSSPGSGWTVGSWTGTDNNASTSMINTVTMPAAERTANVNYVQITYTLSVEVDPAASGATDPAVGVHTYASGAIVTVTAIPVSGYVFDHWTGACTSTESCSVTMDADKTITAHFIEAPYYLYLPLVDKDGSLSGPP